jgi:hypothetical protein
MVTRSYLLIGILLVFALPLQASQKAKFLRHATHTCTSRSANGREFEIQYRAFRWRNQDKDVYTGAVAYYAPDTGEFLWWRGPGFTTKEAFLRNWGSSTVTMCKSKRPDIAVLEDGEWADFHGQNGGIHVFHSNLKFSSMEKGWQYVAEHPEETSSWLGGKWLQVVDLDKAVGDDFSRPERLRFSAQGYFYDSLAGVTKVGSTWQVEIKGADERNRALVVLDSDFKLIKVTRISTPK